MEFGSREVIEALMSSSVQEGNVGNVMLITERFGLSYSPKWLDGYALLCKALRLGQTLVAQYLIGAGSRLNHRVLDHGVALHIAVRQNLADIVNQLLAGGALVDARVKFYNSGTALHEAAIKGNVEIAIALLQYGADPHMTSYLGKTALYLAAQNNHSAFVDWLLRLGVDVNTVCEVRRDRKKENRTVLYAAVKAGFVDVVKCLLKHHPDVNDRGNHDAVIVAMYEHAEIFSILRDYGFIVMAGDERNVLFDAICRADVAELKESLGGFEELLRRDDGRCTPLHVAARYQLKDVVKLMISCGAKNVRDENGKSPLVYAIERGDFCTFGALLTGKGDLNQALCEAVKKGDVRFIEGLLKSGADVNARDEVLGLTVLHLAIRKSKSDVLNILLGSGADIESVACIRPSRDNYTPLLYSIHHCKANGCEILLKRGADVNAKSSDGYSALQLAKCFRSGPRHLIPLLLKYGADVNAGKHGTALHSAAASGCWSCVELLLDYGSDINLSSRGENSPLDCARTGSTSNAGGSWSDVRRENVSAFNCLLRHLVKTKAAGLCVNSRNQEYLEPEILARYCTVDTNPYEKQIGMGYPSECASEIEMLKAEEIKGCCFTFYDILTASYKELLRLSKNETVKEILFLSDFEKKFPIYGTMIESKFLIGRRRVELEDTSSSILLNVYPSLTLDCVDIILSYLTNSELIFFVNSCGHSVKTKPFVHARSYWAD